MNCEYNRHKTCGEDLLRAYLDIIANLRLALYNSIDKREAIKSDLAAARDTLDKAFGVLKDLDHECNGKNQKVSDMMKEIDEYFDFVS